MASINTLPNLYLSTLSTIYTIAFISYYVQYPALSSTSGIEPCTRIFQMAFPRVYEFTVVSSGWFDVDSFVEVVCLMGVLVSVLLACGIIQHGILFIAISSMYQFLYTLGGTFYTFQWDILLLETGYLTALCFAPWTSLRLQPNKESSETGSTKNNTPNQEVSTYPLRLLLHKLMLMSGIVKIQAECPTWENLTALEYHFATQCLPGPLAWHAHNLHPFLLRLGVAATFVIEIPAAYFLICPFGVIRRVGAWMQVLLQVLILGTGNYNFFNLLTIGLCMPCLMGDERRSGSGRWQRLQLVVCVLFLMCTCTQMFEVYYEQHPVDVERQVIGLKLALSKQACNQLVQKTVTPCVVMVLVATICNAIRSIFKESLPTRRLSTSINALVCIYCIIATAVPLYRLAPSTKQPVAFQQILQTIPHQNILTSSGYGLFRRMTGVGTFMNSNNGQSYGWAGVPPSVVARPEIIIEAVIEDGHNQKTNEENEVWQELNFRWKPGNVTHWPGQVAPHQPRFDWRMWFAALGSYHHNPWFISFLDKLLNACPIVIDLLDEPELTSGKKRIKKVRANLYEYDFTRLDTEFARGIPGVAILQDRHFWSVPEQVWSRKLVQQYLPPIERNNPSVRQYLDANGFGDSVCVEHKDRCMDGPDGAKLSCQLALAARSWNRPCQFALTVLALCLTLKWKQFSKPNVVPTGLSKVKEVKAD